MNEEEYIDSIDTGFPYRTETKWKATIDEGVSISDNAAYAALYEICAAPPEVFLWERRRMIAYWSSRYEHPTKQVVLKAVTAIIEERALSEEQAIDCLEGIAPYVGLDSAAIIIYHASSGDSPAFLKKYNEIGDRWGRTGRSDRENGDSHCSV